MYPRRMAAGNESSIIQNNNKLPGDYYNPQNTHPIQRHLDTNSLRTNNNFHNKNFNHNRDTTHTAVTDSTISTKPDNE